MDAEQPIPQSPKIVVVGPCAAGKSTLVDRLRGLGYQAAVCAQEHSEIATLWRRTDPEIVIFLDADLATIRARRGEEWPDTIYQTQQRRLRVARDAATLILDAAQLDQEAVFARVLALLETRGASSS